MGEWFEGKLADVCASIDYGLTASACDEPVGPKFLRITDIVGTSLNWNEVPFVPASETDAQKFKLHNGDIVIARTGATTGESRFIIDPPNAVFASYLVRLKINRKNNPRFISYWLKSPAFRNYLEGVLGDKSAQPNASASTMTRAPIRIPAIVEGQNYIASVLGAIDDKIELNRRMNETLEALARAIFKDWFVDFGPTRAKAEGRAPYLAPELWDLFPDALDDEDKPVGWEQGTLADIAESPRRSVNPADLSKKTPYIGLEHMPRRSIALSEWEGAGKVKSNKTLFHKGEILFGKLRPYFHKVGVAPLEGICSTDIVVVVPRAQEWRAFALACLSSDEFVDYTDRTSTGTKMPRTNWKAMAQYKMYLPPERVVCAFQITARPLLDRLEDNIHETSTLAETRDLLLPKLMSGEIRLRDAEKVVEAVA